MNAVLPDFNKNTEPEHLTLPPEDHTCIVVVNDDLPSTWLLFQMIATSKHIDDLFYIFTVSDNEEDVIHTNVLEMVKILLQHNKQRYDNKFWMINTQKGKDQTVIEAVDEALRSMFKSYRFENLHIYYAFTKEHCKTMPWEQSEYSKYFINPLIMYYYNTIARWVIRYKPDLAKFSRINTICGCCKECDDCKSIISDLQIKYNLTKDENIRNNIREFIQDKFGYEMGYVDNLKFGPDGYAINPEVYGNKPAPIKIRPNF